MRLRTTHGSRIAPAMDLLGARMISLSVQRYRQSDDSYWHGFSGVARLTRRQPLLSTQYKVSVYEIESLVIYPILKPGGTQLEIKRIGI